MKKLVALLLALCMVVCLFAGCKDDEKTTETTKAPEVTTAAPETDPPATEPPVTDPPAPALDGKIAFVTDTGNIDDKSFNQYSYEGVTMFGADNGIETQYYKPTEDSDQARIDAISQAITDGAKIVVMAGFLFGKAVYDSAIANPDTLFLALDVSVFDMPADADGNPSAVPANVALITYQEEQAGFLAGYAAVKGGYKELGFLGGIDVPAVIRYGFGFLQGANVAAGEDGIEGVNVKYWYSGSFAANDEIQTKMNAWYTEGTEVVFACGGGIVFSALAAADSNDGLVIGVDVDQSNLSEDGRIITSAMKALSQSVIVALTGCAENGWAWSADYAGKQVVLGAAQDCVGLPMDTTAIEGFDAAAYDTLFAAIKDGSQAVSDATDAQPEVPNITVDYQ